jgi:hypothetical protein
MLDHQGYAGKVGLVTIIAHSNFGNRLQNYAMQRIISDLGFSCSTILNVPRAAADARPAPVRPRSLVRRLGGRLKRRLFRSRAERERVAALHLRAEKEARGRAFSRAHIRETDFTIYRDTPADALDPMYDYFVVGSDQVWNPEFRELAEVDFLTFAGKRKRIAFSASIGIPAIPEEHRAFYSARLRDFAHISVREDAAAAIVHELTGRTVPVTIDPTLMLGAADWTALATPHRARPRTDYLLTYFLGPRSAACDELVRTCADRLRLKVVHLNDFSAGAFYAADPAEFLDLVRNARLHFTDSFHGAIFSVIFGTPFVSFDRDFALNMGSRLDTLLATLKLEHHKFAEGMGVDRVQRLLAGDMAHVGPILERKRAEARAYLASALERAPAEGVMAGKLPATSSSE